MAPGSAFIVLFNHTSMKIINMLPIKTSSTRSDSRSPFLSPLYLAMMLALVLLVVYASFKFFNRTEQDIRQDIKIVLSEMEEGFRRSDTAIARANALIANGCSGFAGTIPQLRAEMREAASDNRLADSRLGVLMKEVNKKDLADSFLYEYLARHHNLTRMLSTNEQLYTLSTQLSILNC